MRRNERGRRLGLLLSVCLVTLPAMAQMEVPELSHRLTALGERVEAPKFTLTDMDGEAHSRADYRGKVVLVNFWATWCPPCIREMPSLERVHQALKQEPFVVLAVNQWENADHVFAFMGQIDVFPSFPILFDRDSAVSEAYGVKGLPTSFILDKQGRVVYRAIGGREFDHPEILTLIRALIAEQPSQR
ncbi:MAG: TlpA disulfide reductase family protein [Gammaproteobacteria bacterium]